MREAGLLSTTGRIGVAVAAAAALCGCVQQETGGGPVTGAAGGASNVGADANLQRCAEPLGTLAVDDGRTSSWFGPFTAGTQITTIEPMVRSVVQQSSCLVLAAMGNSRLAGRMRGLIGDMRESGEFRASSGMHRGQRMAADYFLESASLLSNVNAGGLGATLGGWVGFAVGSAKSALSQSSTSVTMSLFDIRSGA